MELGELHLSPRVISSNPETEEMELPPGFRFHPTDEELITHYLSKKALDASFDARAIAEVDFNKCEPWDLPQRGKLGEKEWYFFCVRDRKYPTGLRTNRATDAGYWKATGKDKGICRGKVLVGMKKTLVFYRGRAPRGEKTNWVMHEYRLEGFYSIYSLSRAAKNEWVLCRVFKKRSIVNGKEAFGIAKLGFFSYEEAIEEGFPSLPTLPPLMDIPCDGKGLPPHVTCFSNAMEGPKAHDPELMISASAATAVDAFHCFSLPFEAAPESKPSADMSSIFLSKFIPMPASLKGGDFMNLLEGDSFLAKQGCKMEREMLTVSQETGLTTDMNQGISSGDEIWRNSFEYCLWNC